MAETAEAIERHYCNGKVLRSIFKMQKEDGETYWIHQTPTMPVGDNISCESARITECPFCNADLK